MSKGNPEQPTAQAPRGHSSPNRVEVRGDGQQGPQSPGTPRPQSPGTPGLQDQPVGNGTQDRMPTGTANNALASKVQGQGPTGPNGQSRESSGEQRATGPAGTGAARPGAAGGSPQSPGTAPRPQPTADGRPSGPESSIHAAATRAGTTDPAEAGAAGVIADDSAEARALAAGSATTASAGRRPSCERFRPSAAAYSSSAESRDSPCTAGSWCRTGVGSAAASSSQAILWSRLGFGRKGDQPEVDPTAQPAQQQPAAPMTQPPPTSPAGMTGRLRRQVQSLRPGRRLVRRSSSARRLETSPVPQPGPRGPR